MNKTFEHTSIWSRYLSPTDGSHVESVERLRVAHMRMRDRVAVLVETISADCKGLTVHDVTHLDALWDIADLLVGPTYEFTPAEVFVLGGAILLHDAGMSLAAFPNGKRDVQATREWKENLHSILRRESLFGEELSNRSHPEHVLDEALFSTLRDLHADVAERLATQSWRAPDGSTLHLLEDEGLRNAYGRLIGRIAHSHHWEPERLLEEFQSATGAAPGLPPSWTINERKVAFVLRCADAAHIDERRAPTFRYSLAKPKGISREHWSFQNKLTQPTADGDKLVYSSGSDFALSDAPAWWRAFAALRVIQRELEKASALLPDAKAPPFALRTVAGIDSPRSLSRFIKPAGWEPVRAEIAVSDPVALAKTLGGQNLYGNYSLPAVRELLQNSADAIRARRQLESRPDTWGWIRITIASVPDSPSEAWLTVDDDGVGMSRNILTGPLIDFGKSIWNSPMLREEFPGLAATNLAPIGKYGIGFFSVFMLGDQVTVTSKRYNQGDDQISVLQFNELSRPILRRGSRADLPADVTTRVSVRVNLKKLHNTAPPQPRRLRIDPDVPSPPLDRSILSLVAALDVRVTYENLVTNETFDHAAGWKEADAEKFLTELYGERERDDDARECYARMLRPIVTDDGKTVGRAAMSLTRYVGPESPMVSVGGFAIHGSYPLLPYVGVIDGDIANVSRDSAVPRIPEPTKMKWLEEQAAFLCTLSVHDVIRVTAGRRLFSVGVRTDNLPICFFSNKVRTLRELRERLDSLHRVLIPVNNPYSDNYEALGIHSLDMDYGSIQMNPDVLVFLPEKENLFRSATLRSRRHQETNAVSIDEIEGREIKFSLEMIQHYWQSGTVMRLTVAPVFAESGLGYSSNRQVLEVRRAESNGRTPLILADRQKR